MSMPTRLWCEWAWTGSADGTPEPGVLLEIADGRFTSVTTRTGPCAGAEVLSGVTLPGMADAHSHAFHRVLRGRTHADGGSFWTWREVMYRAADRLTPDTYLRLARAVYAEMALAGVTCVGEFHYLHHARGGTRYADPNEMGRALVAAASDAGVRLTLLDVCYLAGGLEADGTYRPLVGPQLRFGDGDAAGWAERVRSFGPPPDHALLGVAAHSVRAVPPEELPEVAAAGSGVPLHIHLSEQPEENTACLAAHGRTPTAVLDGAGLLGENTTLVHATHLTDGDIAAIRSTRSSVCLCPTTERDLADGLPRTGDLDARRLSLGSDQHARIDMFEEARAVELHERLRTHRRGTLGSGGLLRAATAHGTLGWKDAGALAAGARADLVNVPLEGVRLAGADPARGVDAVVFGADASDVRHVMADGRWIVRDGVHTRMPDLVCDLDTVIKEILT